MNQDYSKNFDEVANSPGAWLVTARSLKTSAEILRARFEEIDLSDSADAASAEAQIDTVFLMLEAMRVECLLKAVRIDPVRPLARDGQYVGPTNHDLEELARSTLERRDETLDDAEIDLLQRLARYNSGGRYPIARRWAAGNRIEFDASGNPSGFLMSWHRPQDDERLEAFAERLTEMLVEQP